MDYSEKILTLANGYVILASDCLSLKPLLLRCARNALRYMSLQARPRSFPDRCSFPFRLPLLHQLLCLGNLGLGHLIGERITK